MSATTVNPFSTKRCKCCLQTKPLRKLGQIYKVKGKFVNYSHMLSDCFPKHWSPGSHDSYLCLLCIKRLRAASKLRKTILQSCGALIFNHGTNKTETKRTNDDKPLLTDDVCHPNKNMSKQIQNQVENCDKNLDNPSCPLEINGHWTNGHSIFGFSMDETPIIKDEDENYTDTELILIENRYTCNQEAEDIPTETCAGETKYAHLEFTEQPGAVLNDDVNNPNQGHKDVAQRCMESQEDLEINEVEYLEDEYLEDEYMDLEFNKDDNIQDKHLVYNNSQSKLDNGIADKEDIFILNIEHSNSTNTLNQSENSPQIACVPEIIPNSEEDIIILNLEEQEPTNELINELVYTNCEPIDSNCEMVNHEVDTTFNNVMLQLNPTENEQNNKDFIILQVEGLETNYKQVGMLKNVIPEQNTNGEGTNNVATDDGHKVQRKKNTGLKKKRTIEDRKPGSQMTYDRLKEAVVAIKEGRLSVTQAVLTMKTSLGTFHRMTTELFGVSFPRKDKKWDYRGYFREIVAILNTTNCTPFKMRGNNLYCAYCGTNYKDKGGDTYTPEQLREHVKTQHSAPTYEHVKGFMYPVNHHELIKIDIFDLECTKCPRKVDSWSSMLEHLSDTHDTHIKDGLNRIIPHILHDTSKCLFCEEIFTSYIKLEVHMNVHYPNYICNECGLTFAKKHSLHRHRNQVHHDKVYCDKCGMDFKSKFTLQSHIFNKHGNNKLKCSKCRKQFSRLCRLAEHEVKCKYGEPKPCNYCEKIFYSEHCYTRHIKEHTQEDHMCNICNTTYKGLAGLKGHIRRVHIDDIYYECEVCKHRFGTKNYLSKHQKRHHFDVWISKRQVLSDGSDGKAQKYSHIRKEDDYVPKVRSDT